MTPPSDVRLAIDIGGTFTDTVLMNAACTVLATSKVPTTPDAPARGALEGAHEALTVAGRRLDEVTGFVHGTTLATNALIERRGARVATITNEGFRDILEIAYERRYSQYNINIEKPDLIVPRKLCYTIAGRMTAQGREHEPLAHGQVGQLVRSLRAEGVEAVAVCLLHSYANGAHERILRDLLLAEMPEMVVSLSHEVSPEAREFDRLCTTIANAYIQPLMAAYLTDTQTRFEAAGLRCPILMMTAGGGMTTVQTAARLPIRLVESGPAGGAILAARLATEIGAQQVLSFDMGGTTAKLCLIDGGRPQTTRAFEIARAARFIKGSGMPVRIPVIEMIEIGAGGGSVAGVDKLGRVTVGPESAGAEPGPAGFAKGGRDATVTDADIQQGYIHPRYFAEGRLTLDPAASAAALVKGIGTAKQMDVDAAATAVSEIVDEAMASAARMHAVESGKDLGARVMVAFGGNGPLHATRVARRAGVTTIVIPPGPGVGSAIGFLHAPVSFEIIRSHYSLLDQLPVEAIGRLFDDMRREAEGVVRAGAPSQQLTERRVAFMRYHGQGHEIEIELSAEMVAEGWIEPLRQQFETAYSAQFGRVVPGMEVEILNWGLSLAAQQGGAVVPAAFAGACTAAPCDRRRIWCNVTGAVCEAPVYQRADLPAGATLTGPALIVEPQTTTFVGADFAALVDTLGNIWLTVTEDALT
ncbi:MAG: hydantoinase/oxoprolinase family protein [Roseobacter sp.]|jgi:N-methylhydantoinase A|nr:hydantoinase/oxoprolinase family protein [Roseobacter sp.]